MSYWKTKAPTYDLAQEALGFKSPTLVSNKIAREKLIRKLEKAREELIKLVRESTKKYPLVDIDFNSIKLTNFSSDDGHLRSKLRYIITAAALAFSIGGTLQISSIDPSIDQVLRFLMQLTEKVQQEMPEEQQYNNENVFKFIVLFGLFAKRFGGGVSSEKNVSRKRCQEDEYCEYGFADIVLKLGDGEHLIELKRFPKCPENSDKNSILEENQLMGGFSNEPVWIHVAIALAQAQNYDGKYITRHSFCSIGNGVIWLREFNQMEQYFGSEKCYKTWKKGLTEDGKKLKDWIKENYNQFSNAVETTFSSSPRKIERNK